MKTKLLVVLFALALGLDSVSQCRAEDNTLGAIADVTLVRPGCLVATVIGSVFFVVALPFAAMSGSVKQTANTLVATPAAATFTRPVGDFTSIQ